MIVEPIILAGERIRLEPLTLENHFDDLCAAAFDEEIWRWAVQQIKNTADLRDYLETALDEQRRGASLPFATVLKESGKAIGSTRFGSISRENKRVEIGWTWIGRPWQRTFVNTEAKYLMLQHAFETWQCVRVELKTDALNAQSRNAILRLGALEEGIFRKHMLTDSGRFRDSVYFSILNDEWTLKVKENLKSKLER